jgi:hypothetical protein
VIGLPAEPAGRERYEAQVAAALGAVDVRQPAAFLWFGRRVSTLTPGPRAQVDEALARALLVQRSQQRLYTDFYSAGAPRPRPTGPVMPADDGGEFVRALSQANCGRGSWQTGWRVAAVDGDAIAVVRPDGLRLLAPADDCRVDGAVSAGTPAHVRIPKERLGFSPGYYHALGDTPSPAGRAAGLVQLCWNIAAAGAVTLLARVTYALNGSRLPFSLELPDNPARYGRLGSAILVLARADFALAMKLLRPLLRALGPQLADGAPALTRPLARGLALAEQPGDGQSFGEHRCQLLAEAIVTASEQGLRTTEQRLAVVRERFRAAGLSLGAPYLEPGSDDAYERS